MSTEEAWLAQADHAISDAALDTIFRNARTMRQWRDKPLSPALLMAIYDLARLGPTESNITPARFHFVVSREAKARLEPLLDAGNRKQTMAAPATAIVAYDLDFARTLTKVAPRNALGVSIEIGSPPHHMRQASAIIKERPSVTSTCANSLPGRRRSNRRSTNPPNTATEKSCPSRACSEYAVLCTVVPISTAIDCSAPQTTPRVIGSTGAVLTE